MKPRTSWLIALLAAMVFATGCAGAEAGESLAIVSPSAGSRVTAPFTMELSSGVELGEPGSERHYVKVYYDGIEGETVTDETFEVDDLVPGPHAIHVSLFDPDGTLSGGEDEIEIVLTGDGRE